MDIFCLWAYRMKGMLVKWVNSGAPRWCFRIFFYKGYKIQVGQNNLNIRDGLELLQFYQMTELISPLKHRTIATSMGKLQKAASEGKFRIKSLRTKTLENDEQKIATQKDYQNDLLLKGYSQQFLKTLYILKSEESQLKISDIKYLAFVKSLSKRLEHTKTLHLASFNFLQKSAELFLKKFIKNNKDFNSYDFSSCTYLKRENLDNWIALKCLRKDKRISKLLIKNLSLIPEEMEKVLNEVLDSEKIFQLDVGNEGSQTMNRFGENIDLILQFTKKNSVTAILKLDNLSLRKQGIQNIQKGISANACNPLKILSLKNNAINEHASLHIALIVRSGLVSLNLAQNPLGPNFFLTMPSWKASTVRHLDISMTEMNSEALIYFLNRLQDNKSLHTLVLDRNDFSHHWFNQMKQIMETNNSIQNLSLVDCKIIRFSEFFTGINYNRYLHKLNISINQFDEGIKELCHLGKVNKTLTEIKMKFCSLKPEHLAAFFNALTQNYVLSCLDISENTLGEEGAQSLLRLLNTNNSLNYLISDKVQIPLRLKKQIDEKIKNNRVVKYKKEFRDLKRQNVVVKTLDIYTWDDVATSEKKVMDGDNVQKKLQKKIQKMEKDYDRKKNHLYDLNKEWLKKERTLQNEIEALMKREKQIQLQKEKTQKMYDEKIKKCEELRVKEEEKIVEIERFIRQESILNRKRENELEDLYENKKYLNKQKEKEKQVNKIQFDHSTSLKPKKKPSKPK